MKLALVQLQVLEKNKAGNVAHGLELLRQAAKEHDIVVLPEVWPTGYSLGHLQQEAESFESDLIKDICQIAKENECSILAGSIPMSHDGKIYNTSVAVSKNGSIVNYYDKVHLFGLFNEEQFFAPGQRFNAFELDGICCGSTICYDLRFPVWARNCGNEYDLLIYVANWPTARISSWDTLLPARAVENEAYVCGCNRIGEDNMGFAHVGHSAVYDYKGGNILAFNPDEEGIKLVELNKEGLDRFRSKFPAFKDADKFVWA